MLIEAKPITELNLKNTPRGTIAHYWLMIVSDALGTRINIPVMVARGNHKGPTLGLTAAVHGDELNGIPVIQRLFDEIDVKELHGTIVGIPVVNVPSFERKQRRFIDGIDLNHVFPGKANGTASEIYAYRFVTKVVSQFDYLLDLHTASSGRINSYYVRADMEDPKTKQLAMLQNADLIVHNTPSDGTLRGAADELKIPSITIEIGNPSVFQKTMIRSGIVGIHNVLSFLKMFPTEIEKAEKKAEICERSYWIYTDRGGLLTVHAGLLDKVKQGDLIATLKDVFGNNRHEYLAPEDGIIIGKSVSPVNQTGGRILHLGIIK